MKTIYADFNDVDEHGNLPLTCEGSKESVNNVKPGDHEQVLLTDGDLWVVAEIRLTPEGWFEAIGRWRLRATAPKAILADNASD